jgi:hypothetical protein
LLLKEATIHNHKQHRNPSVGNQNRITVTATLANVWNRISDDLITHS